MLTVYLDHPIGETNGEDSIRRADNIANAGDWWCFLVEITRWNVQAPWYVYAVKNVHPSRRMVDNYSALERSDLYVPCGGIIAPHMAQNMRKARQLGVPILDMTMYGVLPPPVDEDIAQIILARARKIVTANPRRVWVPLLTSEQVAELVKASHALAVTGSMPGEHDAAVETLNRILEAANRVVTST